MKEKSITLWDKIKFTLILVIGVSAFLVPFSIKSVPVLSESNILISHIKNVIDTYAYTQLIYFAMIIQFFVIASAIIGLVYRLTKKEFKNENVKSLCSTSYPAIISKILGAILFLMVALNELGITMNIASSGSSFLSQLCNLIQDGYNIIVDSATGGTTFGLVLSLVITFFFGNLLLPLLTDYGAVEFIGGLAAKFMNGLFRLPGYSAIDAIASFVGDGTIGIMVTDKQYQKGYYTKRQAGVIASSFSIVGIAFATLVAEELGLGPDFLYFYGSIIIVTIILAIILSRVNFFNFDESYYKEELAHHEDINISPKGAFEQGVRVCKEAKLSNILKMVSQQILSTFIIFVPTIMLVGTIGLIIAECTPIFNFIATPFIPLLEFFGFGASAPAMAPGLFVGIADMYLPSLLLADSSVSSAACFFIGVLSFSQLVFLSETGMILLNTKIGFKFFDVIKLFLIRTVLSVPIILIITYLLSYVGILSF